MSFLRAAMRGLAYCGGMLAAIAGTVMVASAQVPPPSPRPTGPNAPRAELDLVTSRQFLLTASLLLFGLIIIFLEFLLLRNRVGDRIEDLGKFFIITLIIIGTLVLIGAGFNAEQIAPVIGLFGTVAGYLLGRSANSSSPSGSEAGTTAAPSSSVKQPPKAEPGDAPHEEVNPPSRN